MKTLIVIAAAALAFPVYAQQKQDLPSSQERAQNREKVQDKVENTKDKMPSSQERAQNREKVQDKLPTADERAKNREKVATTASNATLTGKVKSALASDAGAKTMTNVNVDSDNGVVTLKGKVDSADMKKKAGDIAKKVEGVKSVKNQLTVEKKS
jgi:hyperosmotically inducible periplasmic protein